MGICEGDNYTVATYENTALFLLGENSMMHSGIKGYNVWNLLSNDKEQNKPERDREW